MKKILTFLVLAVVSVELLLGQIYTAASTDAFSGQDKIWPRSLKQVQLYIASLETVLVYNIKTSSEKGADTFGVAIEYPQFLIQPYTKCVAKKAYDTLITAIIKVDGQECELSFAKPKYDTSDIGYFRPVVYGKFSGIDGSSKSFVKVKIGKKYYFIEEEKWSTMYLVFKEKKYNPSLKVKGKKYNPYEEWWDKVLKH